MSTLKADTIQSTGGGAVTLTKQSAAKVIAVNNVSALLSNTFNVSSLGDNGTGDFTINISSAMGNVNYSVTGSSIGSTNDHSFLATFGSNPATTSYRFLSRNESNASVDTDRNSTQVGGDLA
jgi:hypothetical protein